MLKRVVLFLACTVVAVIADTRSIESRLIGTWVTAEYPQHMAHYVTYGPDHTRVTRYADGTAPFRASWRVDGDQLIETWLTGPYRGSIDKCRFSIRGDRLIFGLHETTRTLHGRQVEKPESWMTGVTYRRVK